MPLSDHTLKSLTGRDRLATAIQFAHDLSDAEVTVQATTLKRLVDCNFAVAPDVWKRTKTPRRVNVAVWRHCLDCDLGVTALGPLMIVARHKLGVKRFVGLVRQAMVGMSERELRVLRNNLDVVSTDCDELRIALSKAGRTD